MTNGVPMNKKKMSFLQCNNGMHFIKISFFSLPTPPPPLTAQCTQWAIFLGQGGCSPKLALVRFSEFLNKKCRKAEYVACKDPTKVVFHQRSSSTKGRLPLKVIFQLP